ncbi:MAG: asparagine synthase-related protein [Rhizomicrobium sp.]
MTALAGRWNFDGKPDAGRACANMLAAQAIYGPDDSAQTDMGTIALGRRLFRTLPEDVHDNQPLSGGEGRFAMVADVRLDNRDELIAALRIAPEQARELADSAILLAAWARWEDTCFDRLFGDYAFALFDFAQQKLVLARDPLGNRPLHYHRADRFVAFASMPKGLHALAEIPRQPDEERVAEQLALLPETGPETYFRDVRRVEPGCFVTITPTSLIARRHWEPVRKPVNLANADAYAEELRHRLDEAVRVRLRGAGGEVGAHLSSGFDSAIVATSAAIQQAKRGGRVVAYTSVPREGYDGKAPRGRLGDEGTIAARTAAIYPNMEHVRIRPSGRTPLDNLDRSFFLYERPVLNLCNAVWSDGINDAAKARKLRVMLNGQMGNMSISYDGLTLLPELLRRGRLVKWLREGRGIVRRRHLRWLAVLNVSFGPYTPTPLFRWINRVLEDRNATIDVYSALSAARREELDIEKRARARGLDLSYRPRTNGFETRLWVLRRVDLGNYNKGQLAGWSVDQRDPTADRRLLEFSLNIPEEQFLANGQMKALTRRAFGARLVPEVLTDHIRGYQAVDWHEGLEAARPKLLEELGRLEDCGPAATALDLQRLRQLMADWPEGGWEKVNVMVPYRLALLRGISSGHFLRRASGSNA